MDSKDETTIAKIVREEVRRALDEEKNVSWEIHCVKFSKNPPDSPYIDWEPFAVQGDYIYWRRRN